jgi:transposase InsO family protein
VVYGDVEFCQLHEVLSSRFLSCGKISGPINSILLAPRGHYSASFSVNFRVDTVTNAASVLGVLRRAQSRGLARQPAWRTTARRDDGRVRIISLGQASGISDGLIHHSDRGSLQRTFRTYASTAYQKVLLEHGLKPSMSATGNCYDNAAMESFFGRFKVSAVKDRVFQNEKEARDAVFEYIEVFYNRFRKHSALGYKSPYEFAQTGQLQMNRAV